MQAQTLAKRRKRYSNKRLARRDNRTLKYLAELSLKYNVEPNVFFDKIVEAWQNRKAVHKSLLTFVCREANKHRSIFLVTTKDKVVTQFSLSTTILSRKTPLEKFTPRAELIRRKQKHAEAKKRHGEMQIKDLQVGMKRVTVNAKVLEVSIPRMVATRFGFYVTIANALIADETGTIQLPLWNRQIKEVSVGDLIHVENADVIVFRGTRQLKIARNGSINLINV